MDQILTSKYYITRTGEFATDANKKILYIILASCLCYHDYISRNNTEYISIFIGASLFWILIELFLNLSKSRIINPMVINFWYGKKINLNTYTSICLQGIQEGGVVTIIGLYFGDRFMNLYYQGIFHIIIFYMLGNMIIKKSNLKIRSRRQVNTPSSIVIMGSVTLYNFMMSYYYQHHIYRQGYMFISMVYISTIWTYVSYYKRFRSVETEILDIETYKYTIQKHNNTTSFYILTYDVIFEIGIAYVTFYNLFIIQYPII